MVVQPQTGNYMPEGNSDMMEEVPDKNGWVRRGSSLPDSLAKGADGKDGVLCKTT